MLVGFPSDEIEERREALLHLTRGQVRGRAFAMLELWSVWKSYYKDLALLWGLALLRVGHRRELWDVWAVFGGLADRVEHVAYPAIRFFDHRPEEVKREAAAARAEEFAAMEAAAVEGGIDNLLDTYFAGVPFEDIFAELDDEEELLLGFHRR